MSGGSAPRRQSSSMAGPALVRGGLAAGGSRERLRMSARSPEEGHARCRRRIFRTGPSVWAKWSEVGAICPLNATHSNVLASAAGWSIRPPRGCYPMQSQIVISSNERSGGGLRQPARAMCAILLAIFMVVPFAFEAAAQPAVKSAVAAAPQAVPGFWDPRRRPGRPDLSRITMIRFLPDADYPPFG